MDNSAFALDSNSSDIKGVFTWHRVEFVPAPFSNNLGLQDDYEWHSRSPSWIFVHLNARTRLDRGSSINNLVPICSLILLTEENRSTWKKNLRFRLSLKNLCSYVAPGSISGRTGKSREWWPPHQLTSAIWVLSGNSGTTPPILVSYYCSRKSI